MKAKADAMPKAEAKSEAPKEEAPAAPAAEAPSADASSTEPPAAEAAKAESSAPAAAPAAAVDEKRWRQPRINRWRQSRRKKHHLRRRALPEKNFVRVCGTSNQNELSGPAAAGLNSPKAFGAAIGGK